MEPILARNSHQTPPGVDVSRGLTHSSVRFGTPRPADGEKCGLKLSVRPGDLVAKGGEYSAGDAEREGNGRKFAAKKEGSNCRRRMTGQWVRAIRS